MRYSYGEHCQQYSVQPIEWFFSFKSVCTGNSDPKTLDTVWNWIYEMCERYQFEDKQWTLAQKNTAEHKKESNWKRCIVSIDINRTHLTCPSSLFVCISVVELFFFRLSLNFTTFLTKQTNRKHGENMISFRYDSTQAQCETQPTWEEKEKTAVCKGWTKKIHFSLARARFFLHCIKHRFLAFERLYWAANVETCKMNGNKIKMQGTNGFSDFAPFLQDCN